MLDAPAPGNASADLDPAPDSMGGATMGDADGGRKRYHAIGVAAGEIHTCALLDDHQVKCWGNNFYGQLGYGDMAERGTMPSQMGGALPLIDLGSGRTATKIAAGRYATCVVLDDASLKSWGENSLNGSAKGDIGN